MSELVRWLFDNPVRWLIPATLLSCLVGIPLMFWWERHHPASARRPEAVASWRAMSVRAQAAHDNAALAASEAADRIVREEAARVGHLYSD